MSFKKSLSRKNNPHKDSSTTGQSRAHSICHLPSGLVADVTAAAAVIGAKVAGVVSFPTTSFVVAAAAPTARVASPEFDAIPSVPSM